MYILLYIQKNLFYNLIKIIVKINNLYQKNYLYNIKNFTIGIIFYILTPY